MRHANLGDQPWADSRKELHKEANGLRFAMGGEEKHHEPHAKQNDKADTVSTAATGGPNLEQTRPVLSKQMSASRTFNQLPEEEDADDSDSDKMEVIDVTDTSSSGGEE